MKIYVKDNPRTLVLVSDTHSLLFKYVSSSTGKPRCLVELVRSADIQLASLRKLFGTEIHGFIGLIEVADLIFLVTITSRFEVATPLESQSVNRILNVEFFCLNSNKFDEYTLRSAASLSYQGTSTGSVGSAGSASEYIDSNSSDGPDSLASQFDDLSTADPTQYHPCSDLKKLLSDGSFCYSTNFDLTNNLQTRGVNDNSLSIDTYQEEYMWNYFMMNEMIQFRNKATAATKQVLDSNGFLTTVIRGFAKTQRTAVAGQSAALSIISRQSWKRAGTRYNARGIDDDGNVANFVETEIILNVFGKIVCSFVEIRGSIPVFWEQDSTQISLSTPKVQITRSKEAAQPVFLKHFTNLINKYGTVHVVNLLSRKSSEIELSKRYRDHILLSQDSPTIVTPENTLVTEFDFHQQTKGGNYASARRILNYVHDSVERFEYFSYSYEEKKVITTQSGVFRTNCLDCLDRTNLTQQVLGSSILELILHDYNLLSDSLRANELLQSHNSLWADNGDQISQIYTGTNALKSSFSRSGKMTLGLFLSDATKSVTRMYQNNFVDKNKQITIDTLLGRIPGQAAVILYDLVNENVEEQLKKHEAKFTHESVKSIFAGTFNLNGLALSNTPNSRGDYESLADWLMPDNSYFYSEQPDIYVLGFQEVVELNAANILNSDYSKSSIWQKAIGSLLNNLVSDSQTKYTLIRAEQMTSLLLLFFAKSNIADKVTQVEGISKKTGLGGITGNKGAIAIRFNIGATSYCVINSHLASGQQAVMERNNDYQSILNGIYFSRGGKIFNHENVIWLGDLNYRINLNNEDVRKELSKNDLSTLLANDQLLTEIHSKNVFKSFEEKEITFRPTYKFDNYTNNYDSSEKQRTPSWTDRILFRGPLHPLVYDAAPGVLFSDHKPVYSLYESSVKFVDEATRRLLYDYLYKKYKESLSSKQASVSLLDIVNGKASGVAGPRPPRRANTISESSSSSRLGSLVDFEPPEKSHTFMNNGTDKKPEQLPQRPDLMSLHDDKKVNGAPPPPLPRRAGTGTFIADLSGISSKPSGVTVPPPVPPLRKSTIQSPTSPSRDFASASTLKRVSSPPKAPLSSVPAPVPSTTPPPGFSMSVLQPKNKSGSSVSLASTPPAVPAKKQHQSLASMQQQLELNKKKQQQQQISAQSTANSTSGSVSSLNDFFAAPTTSPKPSPSPAPATTAIATPKSATPSYPPGYSTTSVLLPSKKTPSSSSASLAGTPKPHSSFSSASSNTASRPQLNHTVSATSVSAQKKKAPPPIVPKKPKALSAKSGETIPVSAVGSVGPKQGSPDSNSTIDNWKPLVPK